jgi:lauroyl/myristoyl acyltransferase
MLALRTGAWILPGCTYRQPDGRLVIEFRPPIVPDPAVNTAADLTQRCITILEEFIRARPEQWASFYDLWSKTELPVA